MQRSGIARHDECVAITGMVASNGYAAIQLSDLFWLVDTVLDPAAGSAFA